MTSINRCGSSVTDTIMIFLFSYIAYVLLFNCLCMCEWKDGPLKNLYVNVTW